MLYRLLFDLLLLASWSACTPPASPLRNGDLLFRVAEETVMSRAITEATARDDSLKFDHVAILSVEPDGLYAIEATPDGGVVRTELETFLADAARVEGQPGVVVMRVAGAFSPDAAVDRARRHLGEEYDWAFQPDNGRMYCSELVYECYRDSLDAPLFMARPMNFLNARGEMPAFWSELFEKQHLPVPQGVPGTNPNDLAKEHNLMEVCRYF